MACQIKVLVNVILKGLHFMLDRLISVVIRINSISLRCPSAGDQAFQNVG